LNISLENIRIINPADNTNLNNFIHRFEILHQNKGLKEVKTRDTILQPNYFNTIIITIHQTNNFISDTNQSTDSVLRPLFQIIKVAPQTTTTSSCQIIEVKDNHFDENGVLLINNYDIIPNPT